MAKNFHFWAFSNSSKMPQNGAFSENPKMLHFGEFFFWGEIPDVSNFGVKCPILPQIGRVSPVLGNFWVIFGPKKSPAWKTRATF